MSLQNVGLIDRAGVRRLRDVRLDVRSGEIVGVVSASRTQFGAILFGGFMGGLAGGALVIAQAGTFAEGMSAGRGFIAIAIVVLGR